MRHNKLIPSFSNEICDYSLTWLGVNLFIWKPLAGLAPYPVSGPYGLVDWDGSTAFHTPWFTVAW